MIECFLNLNVNLVANTEEGTKGYRASAIANLIAGSPYFNGNLILRGQLGSTNIRKSDDKIIKELAKIRTLDVSELDGLDIDNNFTRFCTNIIDYKGITKIALLNTKLNINNVSFSGTSINLDEIYDTELKCFKVKTRRLRVALKNGAKIEHFILTKNKAKQLTDLLFSNQAYGTPPLITADSYTIDKNDEFLDAGEINQNLLDLGFKFTPCKLMVTDTTQTIMERRFYSTITIPRTYTVTKVITDTSRECNPNDLDLLCNLGCEINATITSLDNKVVSESLIHKINYTIPKKLHVDVEKYQQVAKAALLPVDKLIYKKRVSMSSLGVDSYTCVDWLYPYAKLGISITDPEKEDHCFKYQKKLYNQYLNYKKQIKDELR